MTTVGRTVLGGVLLLLVTLSAEAQQSATPSRVHTVTVGDMGGRGEEHLPGSVLGLPDTTGRRDAGATSPEEIFSLGLDGEIVLEFVDQYLTDGPGPDLTVFENPFLYSLSGEERIYAEPGEVSVSRDGVEWRTFPFDSLTFEGAAGVTPTNGDADPLNPELSGGDHFDLRTIGVDSVRFVRIRDVTRVILANRDHPLYDFTLNGFDLDAVIGHHVVFSAALSSVAYGESRAGTTLVRELTVGDDAISLALSSEVAGQVSVDLYNVQGARVVTETTEAGASVLLSRNDLPSGLYLVLLKSEGAMEVRRILLR